jgi:ribosomal protein S18 acetylase RimI-like enzyme
MNDRGPNRAIDILDHLPEENLREGAALYYTGLQATLAPVFGPPETALAVMPHILERFRCLTAFKGDRLVGILGIHDARGTFLAPDYTTMRRHYGTVMGMTRLMLLMLLDHTPPPEDLYLDGLAVAEPFRGRGIGTALLAAFERHARENGCKTVSLEVVDANLRARRLYERLGYAGVATHSMGPFSRLFGFRTTRRMMKML